MIHKASLSSGFNPPRRPFSFPVTTLMASPPSGTREVTAPILMSTLVLARGGTRAPVLRFEFDRLLVRQPMGDGCVDKCVQGRLTLLRCLFQRAEGCL